MATKNYVVFIPAVIWGLIILTLSSLSGSTIDRFTWSDIASLDKVGHLFFYAVFCLLWLIGFHRYGYPKADMHKVLTAAIIGTVYGGLIEILQYQLIEGRYFDILDLLANILGCIAGVVIFIILKKTRIWIFQ